jgi:hypothetical protein
MVGSAGCIWVTSCVCVCFCTGLACSGGFIEIFFLGARVVVVFVFFVQPFLGGMGIYKGEGKWKLERGRGRLLRSMSGRLAGPMFERLPPVVISNLIVKENILNKLRRTCKANQNLTVEGRPFELGIGSRKVIVQVHKEGLEGPNIVMNVESMEQYFRKNKGGKATEVVLGVDARPLGDSNVVWEWMPSVAGETWEKRSKERLVEFAEFSLRVRAARWKQILMSLDLVCKLQKEDIICVKAVRVHGYNVGERDFVVGGTRNGPKEKYSSILAQKLCGIFAAGAQTINRIDLCGAVENKRYSVELDEEAWLKKWPPRMSALCEVSVEGHEGKKLDTDGVDLA